MAKLSQNITIKQKEEWLLADYLIRKVVEKASGTSDNECHNNFPKEVYFIGNLKPIDDADESLSRRDLLNKLSPSAFGIEYKLYFTESEIKIGCELQWYCFYRVYPTYSQQLKWSKNTLSEEEESPNELIEAEDSSNGSEPDDTGTFNNSPGNSKREDLFLRFKKIPLKVQSEIVLKNLGSDRWEIDKSHLENEIAKAIKEAHEIILQDDERIKLKVQGQFFTIPETALISGEKYKSFIAGLKIEVLPEWEWQVITELSTDRQKNEVSLLLQFVNISKQSFNEKSVELFFFNPTAKFQIKPELIKPFEIELAPRNFRYDRLMFGRGFNCGIILEDDTFITTHTPTFTQYRYLTRTEPSAKFEELTKSPIPVLENILVSMKDYLNTWKDYETIYIATYNENWQRLYQEEYRKDKENYEKEIAQFELGLSIIKDNPDIQLAFKLTNEAFRRVGLNKPKKESWRLFQIVFIVSQIPGIVSLEPVFTKYIEERKFVDIVYFPTGGGKTEAYLGTLVFHCFFDRLRGKTSGTTSWIRFPLRLLTLQQTQRLLDIIGTSELVRKQQVDARLSGPTISPFAVGYFVGKDSAPNELSRTLYGGQPNPDWSIATDEKERQRWKRIVKCPSCGTKTIKVDFDEDKIRVIHRCTNKSCLFEKGEIPFYIIDKEIYRYLPTVLIGTIDKLASIGNTRNLSMVFGKVDGYCKDHGYYNDECVQGKKECKNNGKLVPGRFPGLSGPTLIIQDELHLLKEGFGTFDSHYETFSQYLLKESGSEYPLKIIASSATIEKYERQVEHLYGKDPSLARVFPCVGPTLRDSFYAHTESYPQRIFVGILPHNKTIFNAMLELIEYYHRNIQHLLHNSGSINPYNGENIPGSDEWYKTLDLYYSTLSYFMATRHLDSIKTDIETHVNNEKFANEGLSPISISQLTGNTTTDEVSRVLESLEQFHDQSASHDAVLATNMVSHGVDIDRFNCMLFYGMPRQNAEYIQSSSRVGRSHVGIIFNCLNPIRERDQSHYTYFSKYHEFLGQMVEPVAINRWSTFAVNMTLPGLFMATILQILSNREMTAARNSYYYLDKISQMYSRGEIDKQEIKNILKEAYNAEIGADTRNFLFEEKIDKSVDLYFDFISNPGNNEKMVSNVLIPPPMRGLRDVDEPIKIELDRLGTNWCHTF